MARYIAFIRQGGADLPNAQDMVTRTGLAVALVNKDLMVLTERLGPSVCAEGYICVGNLFRKSNFKRVSTTDLDLIEHLKHASLSELCNEYWGGYVIFRDLPRSGRPSVFRDPSGTVPCYHAAFNGGAAVFSDIEIFQRAFAKRLTVDWSQVGQHLGSGDLRSSRTCLSGVQELLGGMELSVGQAGVDQLQVWSPWDHVGTLEGSDEAIAHRLSETVLGCVSAWSSCFDSILVSASGGLDSSVVAAAVSQTGAPFSLFTMATRNPRGDERKYARSIAKSVNAVLHEGMFEDFAVDLKDTAATHLPRPVGLPYMSPFYQQLQRLQQGKSRTAHFTGHGGDNVFCLMSSATPIVDRFLSGDRSGALKTLDDVCRLTRCSVLDALVQAVRTYGRRREQFKWQRNVSFLREPPSSASDHPWLNAPATSLPGKRVHIARIMQTQNFAERPIANHDHGFVAPLLSQPVVELCLSIPTWRWVQGGRDRAVARRGFEKRLPTEIKTRVWKGSPGAFGNDLFDDKRSELRDLLPNGLLAEKGIIDSRAVATALRDDAPFADRNFSRLMRLAATEFWVRHWDS